MHKRIIRSLTTQFVGGILRNTSSKCIYYHDVGKKYTNMGTALEMIRKHVSIARSCGWKFASWRNLDSVVDSKKKLIVCLS